MYDTFLAVILMCSINGGLNIPDSCRYMQDRLGPVATRATCLRRLDELWVRIMDNKEFLTRFHKEAGDFKLNQAAHRGYCVDPKLGIESEIKKYYFP